MEKALRRLRGWRSICMGAYAAAVVLAAPAAAGAAGIQPQASGMLDCNGHSPIQRSVTVAKGCSDPLSIENGVPARFEDNGFYVGHDEPIIKFISQQPGSGNDVTWRERLPIDPAQDPTVKTPGSDVTHWFELSLAPWFSMALCNPLSYPLNPCTPLSDSNRPDPPRFNSGGGGSSFLEVQFYPPGFAPFVDNISCDNDHWCASLHINDLECQNHFQGCNNNCIEPTNFGWIQRDGIPTGPPGPQLANAATFTPNEQTLRMNPGDDLVIHIFDAPTPDGAHALKVQIRDLSTGQSGFMQASALNGFMATSITNCGGFGFNYEPEYDTAAAENVIPWAALNTNISTQFEIGHFEPCKRVTNPFHFTFGTFSDRFWSDCIGPYENTAPPDGNPNPEISDAPCWRKGFRHGGAAPPNLVTGCVLFFAQNGDLDYDGTSYWPDWPNSLTPGPFPSPFLQQQPTSNGNPYPQRQFQTNAPASDVDCHRTGKGCAVPIPRSPGQFYPYWTQAMVGGQCVWEFGQMPNGDNFGGPAQYGGPGVHFPPNLEGAIQPNTSCAR